MKPTGPRSRATEFEVTIEIIEDRASRLHDYGIPDSAWRRAMALMKKLGSDLALEKMDARAERAFERGDIKACMRWRDLMVAIHAVEEDEPKLIDRVH